MKYYLIKPLKELLGIVIFVEGTSSRQTIAGQLFLAFEFAFRFVHMRLQDRRIGFCVSHLLNHWVSEIHLVHFLGFLGWLTSPEGMWMVTFCSAVFQCHSFCPFWVTNDSSSNFCLYAFLWRVRMEMVNGEKYKGRTALILSIVKKVFLTRTLFSSLFLLIRTWN